MKTIAERTKETRDELGLTQPQLAKLAGVSPGTIGNIESGARKNPRDLLAIARALRVHPEWLQDGKLPKSSDVRDGPDIRGRVPLISWVIAGELSEPREIIDPADATEWLDCPVKHGPRTFCLIVDSVSMDDGTADGYREGEIIFVDPDVSPTPGKDVVVRAGNKTTFKRLKEDGDGRYLLALNGKKIVPVPEGTEYCGVVIFSGVRR